MPLSLPASLTLATPGNTQVINNCFLPRAFQALISGLM